MSTATKHATATVPAIGTEGSAGNNAVNGSVSGDAVPGVPEIDADADHSDYTALQTIYEHRPALRRYHPTQILKALDGHAVYPWQLNLELGQFAAEVIEGDGKAPCLNVFSIHPQDNGELDTLAGGDVAMRRILGYTVRFDECDNDIAGNLGPIWPWDLAFLLSEAQAHAIHAAGNPWPLAPALAALTSAGPILDPARPWWAALKVGDYAYEIELHTGDREVHYAEIVEPDAVALDTAIGDVPDRVHYRCLRQPEGDGRGPIQAWDARVFTGSLTAPEWGLLKAAGWPTAEREFHETISR